MDRLFGTDGIRGIANKDLTPELAIAVSAAAARVLAVDKRGGRPTAVLGRDSRVSGEMLEGAVIAGLTSAGADVIRLGVLPTAAVAYLTRLEGAELGVVLSASHNAMPDNGIKLFSRGRKLPPDQEEAIQAAMSVEWDRPTGSEIGRVRDLPDAGERYVDHLVGTLTNDIAGLRLVVDCAHGAASVVAPVTYQRAGAEVIAIAAEPNGLNINDHCGSTYLDYLAAAVAEHQADVGIAHDGDADRCIAVTANGDIVDGDAILAICALALKERGALRENTVVATVMANLGFHHAMRDFGITVLTTPVGDRHVLDKLEEFDLSLGGEQSGHMIFRDYATTGDGLLTALQLLSRMTSSGRSLSDLASVMQRLPQILLNVPVADRIRAVSDQSVKDAVMKAEASLGDTGRILLRPSGTEPIVRVMVEAPSEVEAAEVAQHLAEILRRM